jgi:hypothetical protein
MGHSVHDNNTVGISDLVEHSVIAAASAEEAGKVATEWLAHLSRVLRQRAVQKLDDRWNHAWGSAVEPGDCG